VDHKVDCLFYEIVEGNIFTAAYLAALRCEAVGMRTLNVPL
jgi:hypothetical protein